MSQELPTSLEAPADQQALVIPEPANPRRPPGESLTHSGMSIGRFVGMHVMGAIFPVTAGLMLYGWRALATMAIVCASSGVATFIWRHIGARGPQLRYSHALWLSVLLSLMLPPHLVTDAHLFDQRYIATWPILPAAGFALVILTWTLGGLGSGRVHPVVITYLLLCALFGNLIVPHVTLQRHELFVGDVLKAGPPNVYLEQQQPWISAQPITGQDAVRVDPASQRLIFFTTGNELPERAWLSLESLLRDRMPPLEDLIIGGHPGPIGTSSGIAIIIGGLFLLYRGLIDYRIPLLIFAAAFICLLILPIPVVITENAKEWRWIAMRETGVGWPLAVTFANYEIMASPLLFMAFFLATAAAVRPMTRRARTIFALLVGALSAICQLYASVSFGPYLALLFVSLLTPTFDKWFHPRTLV
ncbi:MAG TPA: RnfABCDGE type electron transport complex subunit D [Tepidisphaeraceae bacterium]|jgi:Na+-translocating ferredoxin:NAD+ oxidoreductase RnfD subunit|nr:RnfABCDGE type electron transport complex subunit D [Tepidisphaeraceae bacterium]